MSQANYEKGEPPYYSKLSPDFCFSHWSTQCRSAFQAPIDPHLVLGGFPTTSAFRNYSADATSFVVTYPLNSSVANRWVPFSALRGGLPFAIPYTRPFW